MPTLTLTFIRILTFASTISLTPPRLLHWQPTQSVIVLLVFACVGLCGCTWVCLLHLTQFLCHSFCSHPVRLFPSPTPHFPLYCLSLFVHFVVEFVNLFCLTLFLFICCFYFCILYCCWLSTLLESLLSVAASSPAIMEICLPTKSCKLHEARQKASNDLCEWSKKVQLSEIVLAI